MEPQLKVVEQISKPQKDTNRKKNYLPYFLAIGVVASGLFMLTKAFKVEKEDDVVDEFVSKKELGQNIPSISYNLKHGGSVLIDRKDPKQAIPAISGLGAYIEKHNRSAVIFPEGTRSKTGYPKVFASTGLKILCKTSPSAIVIPITINNSWKFVKFGNFPFGLGNKFIFTIHKPLVVKDYEFEDLMQQTEKAIIDSIL